jgi:hypothetical protein
MGCDGSGVEVQTLGQVAGGAPWVAGEELDDACLGVAPVVARSCAPIARAARSSAAH